MALGTPAGASQGGGWCARGMSGMPGQDPGHGNQLVNPSGTDKFDGIGVYVATRIAGRESAS